MTGLKKMLEAIEKTKERSVSIDEQHRETDFPDVCMPDCNHITCGYRTLENKGRPCFMKFAQYKTPPNNLVDPFGMQRQIDEIVKKAFAPITRRLEKLETSKIERSFEFNGKRTHTYTPKLVFSEALRVDRNMNQN